MSFCSPILDAIFPLTSTSRATALPRSLHTPYFFTLSATDQLISLLDKPYAYFIEKGEYTLLDKILSSILADPPDLALSLTTPNAYLHNVAEAITLYLNKKNHWRGKKIMEIQTCLQEAVANAIMHGNLAIESNYQSLENFEAHFALIGKRLESEPFKSRRILVMAWHTEKSVRLAVSDEGVGFQVTNNTPNHQEFCGRGLMLIQSLADKVWIDKEHHSLLMQFTY